MHSGVFVYSYHPPSLKELRKLATTCAVCGYDSNLTVHHIHPRDFKESYPNGSENINEKSNIVSLCRGCHDAVHDKRSFEALLKVIKNKLRRKRRKKRKVMHDDERHAQSQKDLEIQRSIWKRLVKILADPQCCEMIESYRRIIRLVGRVHRATFDGVPPIALRSISR